MVVIFKSIDLKGFLSIGESHVELDNQGTVYVTGQNKSPGSPSSNGAGKSTIFEGIIYALTGTTLRGTKDVVNMYWDKGYCEVTLELQVNEDSYVIKRTRNHPEYKNNLKIWKNDTDISGDKLRKSESILSNELGELTSSLISSVIILGQGLPNKFTDLKPTARKDRLEELSQSSEFINNLKSLITNKTSKYTRELSDSQIKESRYKTEISMNESRLKMDSQKLSEFNSKVIDTEGLTAKKSKASEEINVVNNNLTKFKETKTIIDNKLRDINSMMSDLNSKKSYKELELRDTQSKLKSLAVQKCPTCGQFIKSPEVIKELSDEANSKITQISTELNSINDQINSLTNNNLNPLNEKLSEYSSQINILSNNIISLKSEVAKIDSELNSVNSRIKELTEEINTIRDSIDQANSNLEEVQDSINKLNIRLGILNYLSKIASREFRGYLLIGVVNYINSKLVIYGKELFGTDKLRLILEDNKIYIEYDNRPYENLSGGEKQRADLAMQFSLRDMLINSLGFSCNLLVIDEGFDNLDTSGVEALVQVINNMTSIDSIFTITHHTLSIPFDKTLTVIKEINNVSHIEEVI